MDQNFFRQRPRSVHIAQRAKLCELMSEAFLELRMLAWNGNAAQAADLADAFHNLPALMYTDRFNWDWAGMYFDTYASQHPASGRKYLALFDAITR